MENWEKCDMLVTELRDKVDDLQFAIDQYRHNAEKRGMWKWAGNLNRHECSECGRIANWAYGEEDYEYCPHCGVRMM